VAEVGICHACLSFVSFAVDDGDEREIARQTNSMAPWLWDDGLALPVQAALQRARRRGVAGVEAAIADVEERGPRSPVVKAVVRLLATDLSRRSRGHLRCLGLDRPRLSIVAPDR
jgi:hypothetical protein